MKIKQLFTAADLEAIQRATSAAETTTSGEIVPYIVAGIDDHDGARWRAATLGALAAALLAGAAHWVGDFWGGFGVLWITMPAVAGAAVGYLAAGGIQWVVWGGRLAAWCLPMTSTGWPDSAPRRRFWRKRSSRPGTEPGF